MTAPEGQLSATVDERSLSFRMGALLEGSTSRRPPPGFGRMDTDNGPINKSFWGGVHGGPFCKKVLPVYQVYFQGKGGSSTSHDHWSRFRPCHSGHHHQA